MTRQEFPKKVRLSAWRRSDGHCERCSGKLGYGEAEYHHFIEDFLGGEPTLENCLVLCRKCHSAVTTFRRREIDKTRRIEEKRMGLRKSSNPMPGSKRSRFRKRMDGTVEVRNG